jgi:major membrane immunogen (membrane-anchored lipoprotein)
MRMNRLPLFAAFATLALLAGCQRHGGAADQAANATQAAAQEDAAKGVEKQFDDAVAQQNWTVAKAQADILFAQYPASQAAGRVKPQYDAVKAKAEAAREQGRLANLWSYDKTPVEGGKTQLSASIYSKDDVDTDGTGAKPVRLIFRDHPSWGTSSYLVLQAGDFNCYGGCKVKVQVDDQPAQPMAASRPKTDEAIAMFIEDEKALWRKAQKAKTLTITFPVKLGGTRTAVFETGGVDASQLPRWK